MPDPRASYPVISDHQNQQWPYSEMDRRPTHGSVDALPRPTGPQRERATHERRLAFLRMLAQPDERARSHR